MTHEMTDEKEKAIKTVHDPKQATRPRVEEIVNNFLTKADATLRANEVSNEELNREREETFDPLEITF